MSYDTTQWKFSFLKLTLTRTSDHIWPKRRTSNPYRPTYGRKEVVMTYGWAFDRSPVILITNRRSTACDEAVKLGRVQQPTGRMGRTIDRSAVGQLSSLSSRQNGSDCSDCHFVLLYKDESCPTADLSNIGRPMGPAYSTGELLNTPLV